MGRPFLIAVFGLLAGPLAVAVAGDSPAADGGLRETYLDRSVAAASAEDRYALGLWCREQGLLPEARAQFSAAVKLDPDHAASRSALGERRVEGRWVPSDEALRAKGLVKHDGRWMLPEERDLLTAPEREREHLRSEERRARTLLEAMAGGDARAAKMARGAFEGVDRRARVAPLNFALRAADATVRAYAAEQLGALGDRRALKPLVHRALVDPVVEVRAAALDAAKSFGDPELLAPFARALLNNGNAEVRAAAAENIGRLGDVRGVQYLVWAVEGHGGGPRAHIYLANQLTFVQDFDVEVAQTAFIADPIVGVLQEGAVLDVKVVSTEWYGTRVERRAITGALHDLTGADHGWNASAWRGWMRDNRDALAALR